MKKFIATLVISAFCLGGIGCSGDKTKTDAKTAGDKTAGDKTAGDKTDKKTS